MNLRAELTKARAAELKKKSLSGMAMSIPALLALELVLYRFNANDLLSWVLFFAILSGWGFRYFYLGRANISPERWHQYATWVCLMLGISWGWFFYRESRLAPENLTAQLAIFAIGIGLLATTTYTIGISPVIYRVHGVPVCILLCLAFLKVTHDPVEQIGGATLFFIFWVFSEIQRKMMERHWTKSRLHAFELQALIDTFPAGVLVVAGGEARQTNSYFRNMYCGAHTADEPALVLDRLMESKEFAVRFKAFLEHRGRLRTDFDALLATDTGMRCYWFLLVRNIAVGGDNITVVALDVHAKREAESQIETQRRKLENSAKLAALGEMAAGVAHEINNPIFVISSRAQLMQLSLDRGSETEALFKPHLEAIVDTCDRIVRIVRSLKNVSRESDGEPFERISLKNTIEQTIDLCASRISQMGAKFEVGPLPEDCLIEARPVQLSQMILNLLNNAFDAVEGVASPWVRVDAALDNKKEFVEISVSDSGGGIPQEIRHRVMDPFFTTKPVGKGTGLGLSISQGIVRAHGGQLILDDTASHTKFVARIPTFRQ